MSVENIKKRLCWLLYDADTAISTNNEGALVFNYDLEDIDHLESGADVYNGQQSVFWQNLRATRFDEMKAMYQNIRSTGALSYEKVKKAFEDHQAKWPEALLNEDGWFKYLAPLVEKGNASYLSMLQGSKAEQRKWWLYNRFRYIDSKYNAGDALTNVITVRAYAKSNITLVPFASIYASVKFGSYLVSQRASRNQTTTIVCPVDALNDSEVYIYSCDQLASVGDLSGLKVGYADFSRAIKLQDLKIGDVDANYSNGNLTELYLGNNTLLQTIDVRNCPNLTQAVNLSGCTGIEEVYFDGTAITSLSLPNGGVLKKLHLPGTVTNLTVRNQTSLNEFVMPSYNNITTLWLENNGGVIPMMDILDVIPANSRVRLIGINLEAEDGNEIKEFYDKLDLMRGLDESGNNMEHAQVSGRIHVPALTGAEMASFRARYPSVTIAADHTTSYLYYYNEDGSALLTFSGKANPEPVYDGGNGTYANTTTKADSADGHYSYTADGWATTPGGAKDANALIGVDADRNVYAAYVSIVKTYTVTWKNANGTVLETDTNVPWGTVPTYNGSTPTQDGQESSGWSPAVAAITGDTIYTAIYVPVYTITWAKASEDGGGTITTSRVPEGTTPTYTGTTPTTTRGDTTEFQFSGWTPALAPAYANKTYTAVFTDLRAKTIQYLSGSMREYESNATNITQYSFKNMPRLTALDLTNTGAVTIAAYAFNDASNLKHLVIRSNTVATLSNTIAFAGTPIASGNGAVYVPANLVDSYKAATNWSNYIIFPISEYPATEFSTIRDSWTEIIATINSGDYSKYSVGDTKLLSFGSEGDHYMVLVAKDEDDLADGSTKAATTWICDDLLPTTHRMNATATTSGGYEATKMRTYLSDTILPKLPTEVQAAIKEVSKVQATYESAIVKDGQTTTEKLWIPSNYEVGLGTSHETTGARYTTAFPSGTSTAATNARIKNRFGSVNSWWLRSVDYPGYFCRVSNRGIKGNNDANHADGVAPGFCI